MLQQSRFWAVAALVATFVAGGVIGWAFGTFGHGPRGPRGFGGGLAGEADGVVAFMSRELDLTAAQRDSVRAIFERHRPQLEAIWRETHPRFDSVRTVVSAEISAQLTPSQRARYERMARRMDRPPPFAGGPWEGERRPP